MIDPTISLLYFIVLIKILDMFIYGMPESSPYSFMVYWVIMCLYIKQEQDIQIVDQKTATDLNKSISI